MTIKTKEQLILFFKSIIKDGEEVDLIEVGRREWNIKRR